MPGHELSVNNFPVTPPVRLTGELGISWMEGRWERNGQQGLGPISALILAAQPVEPSWVHAAAAVTGWSVLRVFAFQTALSRITLRVGSASHEAKKGRLDASIYHLLYKLARKTHRSLPDTELGVCD